MAKRIDTKKRVQINKVVKDQLPTYVREENPLVGEFLSQYYQAQEYQGGPIDIINNIDSYIQLNKSGHIVGFTTLNNPINEFDTEISVDSTEGFPDSWGLLKIEDEIITYTGIGTTAFKGCIRGFSGITSYRNPEDPENFIFSPSKAEKHAVGVGTSGGVVENLSILFLEEFLRKSKQQFLPGFQKDLNPGLNAAQFIRHSKDFYNSRGTEESFKILFKSLYNEDVDIVKPADYVISPSNANYRKTRDLIVEPIQGDPQDLVNRTLFQDPYENLSKAYGPVSAVERIRVGLLTDTYFKVSIDASFGTKDGSTELLYGSFGIHATTRAVGDIIVDSVGTGQTYIDVDSTIGFPNKGALTFKYRNGTTGIVTYSGTNNTQFLGVTGITTAIKSTTPIKQNSYAYALGKADATAGLSTDGIRVRITSVLNSLDSSETYYQKQGAKIKLKSLGTVAVSTDFKSNNWIYNISPRYDVESSPGAAAGVPVSSDGVFLYDASNNTYTITTKDFHRIRLGDILNINTKDSSLSGTYTVSDILSNLKFRCRGALISDVTAVTSVTKKITKPNSSLYPYLNDFTANIQNVYMDEVGYAHTLSTTKNLIASQSLPSFSDANLDPDTQKITLSGTFRGADTIIGITTGSNDHNFFTGDAIYYTPQKHTNGTVMSFLFSEGLYFVERINHNDIKLAKSTSNLYDGNYQKISEATVFTTITNNTFEKYDFHGKIIQPQKIFREIDIPVYDGKKYPTTIGYNGVLINGVEVLSYKSKDLVYYGTLNSIDVTGGGRYYDVINPPVLAVNDGVGAGATGFVATRGKFQEIRVLDPGFDYTEVPTISISGGNGEGARAECKLVTVPHQVVFNAGSLSQTVGLNTDVATNALGITTYGGYNVGFLTYHKFRNYERVVYETSGEKALSGLDTGAVYYVNTQNVGNWSTIDSWVGYGGTTWFNNKTIRLHTDQNECIAGVNTVAITGFGEGNHIFRSLNGKAQVGTINLLDSGEGYENKHKTCNPVGVNTALDIISIHNHDYKTGEIVVYTKDPDGTEIEGLTSGNEYYIDVLTENSFKVCSVGIGTTVKDFYFKTRQHENLRSSGVATHNFNYPPIEIKVEGIVGIDSIEGNTFQCIPQPLVRGEVTSVHLTHNGVGYGASEIMNFNRQPRIDMYTGRNCELMPIVANGEIIDVAINNRGDSFNTPPAISVAGVGTGAELVPEIVNGQVVSIKINKKGVGYGQSTTALTVEPAGEFAIFLGNIQTWQVNEVQKNYNNIDGSDVFLEKATQLHRGLQCSYAYAPRSLRKVIYQNDAEGKPIYGVEDLSLLNGITEEDKTRHSPIIGWAYDGNPIYGPYGYEKKSGGNITQMKSGYSLDYKTNRPPLSVFPSEFFIEDFTWNSSTDESYLDENNGRYGITPEYPKGTYAYFATHEQTVTADASDVFNNYKRPVFPYLLGEYYDAQPNEFNTLSRTNQDEIDLNDTTWIRNTEPYELLQDSSYYDYLKQSYKYITQDSIIKYAEEGSIDRIGIVTGGSGYKNGDKVVFEEKVADNFQAVAKVSKVTGVGIGTLTVTNTKLNNIEFYPSDVNRRFVGVHTTPVDLQNLDKVYVSGMSTTSSALGGKTFTVGISSAKLIVAEGIGTVAATGLVTYFKVQGGLNSPNAPLNNVALRENDVLSVGLGTMREEVKILKVDAGNSRIRVLRNQNNLEDGVIGASHTIRTVIEERPRKFVIDVGFTTTSKDKVQHEYYFDPRESLGISSVTGVGIGTTVSFENPGGGINRLFIPARQIYLPNHKLMTGDTVIYSRNTGDSIGIATNAASADIVNPYNTNLPENTPLFVARFGDDYIGLSTVSVGIGTEGEQTATDIFVGTAATTKGQGLIYFLGIGTGRYHSLKTNYGVDVVTGSAEKNKITVSTSNTHGLMHNDVVELTVDAGITTTVPIKYNASNRKLIARTLDFTTAGITTASSLVDIPDAIEIVNHELQTGQRVIYTASTPTNGLVNDEEYFVYVINKDKIKLCGSRFQTRQRRPSFVHLYDNNAGGTLNIVNPPLEFYKNGTVTFDLSDSSLSYVKGVTTYPAFSLEIYKDSNFIHRYESNEMEDTFEVTSSGTVGIDGKVTLKVNQYTPKILYYNIIANTSTDNPQVNKELVLDTKIQGNNTINIKTSRYEGKFKIIANSDNTFVYDLDRYPEVPSYTASDTTKLNYTTTSKTAYGPIAHVSLADKGKGYKRLPGISTVTRGIAPGITSITTQSGTGAILEASSKTIGKPKTTEIENIGFDYPCDFTLRPQAKLPSIIKIDALSGFESIGITSYGKGYNTPPALVVLDGVTRKKVDDVDLRYNLETPDEPGYVDIVQNTYGLSNVTPFIIPVNNPNGIRCTNFVYDPTTETVAATLKVAYSLTDEFPIEIGDKLFIENVSVGVGSTGLGYDSQYYDYQSFNVISTHENLGNVGVVTYSMAGLVPSGSIPGNFNAALSSGVLIQSRNFPQFAPKIKPNIFNANETLYSETSVGPVQGLAYEYDPESKWLTVETSNDFEVGRLIESLETGAKGTVSEIVMTFDSYYKLDYFSMVNNGWEYQTGFLNNILQRVHDNEFYQSFSYAVKSKVFFDKWKDIVNTLNHTAGFKKYSQLQVESKLPVSMANDMQVGIAGTVTGIINIQNYENIHRYNNFDLVTENLKSRAPAEGNFSDEVTFQNRILIDYAESVGNRVLKIDDISPQFRHTERIERWSEVGRWDITNNKKNRFLVYIRDRLFTQERQVLMVNALYDPNSGHSMINQYGGTETVTNLGQMDSVVDGDEAVLQFHPTKYRYNNYNVIILSTNLDELGLSTVLTSAGSTVVGTDSSPEGAVVSIGSSVVLAGAAHSHASGIPLEVDVLTVGTASTTGVALTSLPGIAGISTAENQLFNPRSGKVVVSVATSDGGLEYTEISVLRDDNGNVTWHDYGQLSIHSRRDPLVGGSLGTFRPYVVGVGTTAAIKIGYTPNAGIQTAWINSLTIGISSETFSGVGTYGLRNSQMITNTTSIPAAGTATTVGIASYINQFDGAHCIVQVSDTTNKRYEFFEVMMVDDDTNVYVNEYGNLQTEPSSNALAYSGLGTVGGIRTGDVTELTYTPGGNYAIEVKTFMNVMRIEENSSRPAEIDFGTAAIRSGWNVYDGTFFGKRTEFDILHNNNQVFKKDFNAVDTDVVDLTNNTISLPNHYFVSGEEVVYSIKNSGTVTGVGTTGDSIGIAATYFAGIGATVTYIPDNVFVYKKDDNKIQLCASAADALSNPVVPLDFTSVGIGTSHSITAKYGTENTRALVSIDNVIQAPVTNSGIAASLSTALDASSDLLYMTGITSFYSGDDIRIDDEIMKVIAIGPSAGAANAVKVHRHWMGTTLVGHSSHTAVSKLSGDYNIINNQISFSDAPFGEEPEQSTHPNDIDWVGVTTHSSFSGRVFMRSGVKGSNYDAYTTNYVIDDLSESFNGQKGTNDDPFDLKVNNANITGISTQNAIVLINGILQGAGEVNDYMLSEVSGITSITFTGLAASISNDPNTASIPRGGQIISVGSTEGFGLQPLVSAGATIRFASSGIITAVSIGYSGSGYRVIPGSAGIASNSSISGVGIATEVRVAVAATTSTGTPTLQYIGTAAVINGGIVSIAVTYTDPVPGFPGTGSSTFDAIIDPPTPYQDIPLWYSGNPTGVGGTQARANITVSAGSSVIDFEITNLGYGYGANEVLTVPTSLTTSEPTIVGIPTVRGGTFKEFQLTLERVRHDEFNMWTLGELQQLDSFAHLFDGSRKAFPFSLGSEPYAIQAKSGSPIVVQDTIILTINDVLQVPGEGFTFSGGGTITLSEAPKSGDTMNLFFYRGTGGEDVKDRDIVETVKRGDDLVLGYDRKYNTRDFTEFPRTVVDVKSSDAVDTNPYFGRGLGDDDTEVRPVAWIKQTEDKIIDGRVIRKDRPLLEPNIFPTAYLIQSVGVGSTAIWVDNCKPFFDPENENPVTREFQKNIQIVNASSHYETFAGAAGTAIVSVGNTISSVAISTGGRGYNAVPTVSIQYPVGAAGTPFVGIGTTAAAKATASITAGVVTSITITSPGLAYTSAKPPVVIISSPDYVREENTVDSYTGDYGIVSGVGICSNISDANGAPIGVGTAIVFDLWIPDESPLRDEKVTSPDPISVSGLQTGSFFMVSGSNLGSGVTSVNMAGNYIGIGTTALDNIYEVSHYVGLSTVGYGSDTVNNSRRVFCRVLGWNGLQNTVGYSTLNQGISTAFIGEYSWGLLKSQGRMISTSYTIDLTDGVTGIKTGPQIKRRDNLKSTNYVV